MAYIYCADIYCDACGKAIRKKIKSEGLAPENPKDQHSYDSDEYPKHCDDDETSDVPQHCGSGEDCFDPTIIGDEKYGHFFGNNLTAEGVRYVKEAHNEGGEVANFWFNFYSPDYPELN